MISTPTNVRAATKLTDQQDFRIHYALDDAQREVEQAGERLKKRAAWIRDDMDKLIHHVEDGDTVNSLGELQSSGPELDRLCALYMEKRSDLQALYLLLQGLGLITYDSPTD